MKRTHNKVTDSDDDMDHLPLKYITLDYKKNKSVHELKRDSVHACEFCEKIFDNSYDYLIHNAKHIIIPLIKMLPHHCSQCELCCFSKEEMNHHISVKHNIYNKRKNFKNHKSKLKVDTEHESNEDETPLNCLIKKNDVVVKTENILQNFMMNCKVDVEKFVPRWQYECDEDENNDFDETNKSELINHIAELKPSTEVNNICNGVNNETKIVELIPSPKSNNIIGSEADNFKNEANSDNSLVFSDIEYPIDRLPSVKKETGTECSINQDSIHFSDLIKPGIFYCKRCYKRFPNRFEVVHHEIVHLNVTLMAPESYNFNGKVNSAITIPPASKSSSKYLVCHKSNEEVSNKMHEKTCFTYRCADCGQGFHETNLLSAHEAQCIGLAVVMCDTCLYLRKRPKHVRYYGIIRFNNLEVKQMCHWCGKVCNEMSQVTLVNRQRLADRIKFEGDIGDQETNVEEYVLKSEKKNEQVIKERTETKERKRKGVNKTLSNRERLKLIQTRLKSMKK